MVSPNDKELICVDCHQVFTWTEDEQRFFAEKGFGPPKRCLKCRRENKRKREEMKRGFTPR